VSNARENPALFPLQSCSKLQQHISLSVECPVPAAILSRQNKLCSTLILDKMCALFHNDKGYKKGHTYI
jgi:hypothetical protein